MFYFILILLLLLLRLMSGLNMPPSFYWVLHLRMRASTSMIFCRVVPFWSVTASQLQMLQSGLLLQVQPSETAYLYLFYSDIFKPMSIFHLLYMNFHVLSSKDILTKNFLHIPLEGSSDYFCITHFRG